MKLFMSYFLQPMKQKTHKYSEIYVTILAVHTVLTDVKAVDFFGAIRNLVPAFLFDKEISRCHYVNMNMKQSLKF
jgi:hypothetical protein